jgi:hypothetical protein
VILASLALVVASTAALGWGIATGSEQLVWVALLAGLAAVVLVVGSVVRLRRRLADAPASAASPERAAAGGAAPGDAVAPTPPPPAAWPWPAGAGDTTGPPRPGWTGPVQVRSPDGTSTSPTTPGYPPPGGPGEAAGADQAPSGAPVQPWAGDAATSAPAGGAPGPAPAPSGPRTDPVPRAPSAPGPAVEPADPLGPAATAASAALSASPDRPLGEPFPVDDGEPPVEDVAIRDALRVAQLTDEVQVVDGHPRYHLDDCPTLAGAGTFPLSVSTARRAGFTPCGVCGPDRTLLARVLDRRRPSAG